ncbi:MAG: DUF3857 domain-containing protein [Roseivirga sp.]|nr:DUF3857 domain-containing protein [Roseivirga sp.]
MVATYGLYAQELEYTFGEIDVEDLRMKIYSADSAASAVKLLSYGHAYYNEGTHQIKLVIHERVKVLNKEGLGFGNLALAFPNIIRIGKLRASVYNLNDAGEMVETKVNRRKVFKERTGDRKRSIKVTFPDVKVGSVIEYSFEVNTRLATTFYPWYFQDFIPVRHSEFFVEFPTFASYKVKVVNDRFMDYISPPNDETQRYIAKNLPAVRPEPFVGNLNDYRCAVSFEVSNTSQFRTVGDEQFVADWSGVNRDLLFNISFGQRLSKTKEMAKLLPPLEGLSDREKIRLIRQTVMQQMTWDKTEGLAVLLPLEEAWESKIRPAQEINMLLIAMLREAGFDADPVVISTRDKGNPDPGNAFINQFNYVIAHVSLGDEAILLDAVYEQYPTGLLPTRLINKIGLLVDYEAPRWIDLNLNGEREVSIYSSEINFDEELNMEGVLTILEDGVTAIQQRRFLKSRTEAEVLQYYRQRFSSLAVESVQVENLDSTTEKLKILLAFRREAEEAYGPDVFLNPLIFKKMIENPFKASQRFTPVDYEVPQALRWVYTIKLPESVKIKALPEPMALLLPDDEGLFIYNIAAEKNQIKVLIKYSLQKTFFTVNEYPKLRNFFQEVASSQQAMCHLVR